MAKDFHKSSEMNRGKKKQSASTYRAQHRRISAASAERKRQAGMTRLSVWVPQADADALRHFAKCLCEGHLPDRTGGNQTEERQISTKGIVSAAARRKPQSQTSDVRQLDLFGPA
jgi:hypothetical protein